MKKAKQIPIPKEPSMTANFSHSGRGLFTQVKPIKPKKGEKDTRMYAKNGGASFGNTGLTGES